MALLALVDESAFVILLVHMTSTQPKHNLVWHPECLFKAISFGSTGRLAEWQAISCPACVRHYRILRA